MLDFGVAKAKNACTDTPPGIVKGKLRYMAPEQILGEPVDARADLFAMGMMLWEGLAGSRIGDVESSMALRLSGACPPVREYREECPKALSDLVDWCLKREARERPQDASTLAEALAPFAGSRDEVSTWVRWNFGAMLSERRRDVARMREAIAAAQPPRSRPWSRFVLVAVCAVVGAVLANVGLVK